MPIWWVVTSTGACRTCGNSTPAPRCAYRRTRRPPGTSTSVRPRRPQAEECTGCAAIMPPAQPCAAVWQVIVEKRNEIVTHTDLQMAFGPVEWGPKVTPIGTGVAHHHEHGGRHATTLRTAHRAECH